VFDLKSIGLALQNYHEAFGGLPPVVVTSKDGQPLYSWRVLLLPFLEQQYLYSQFKLDEPWDGPHNKHFLEKMPRFFGNPWGEQPGDGRGMTRFQVFVGPGTSFERDGLTWGDFPDGLANTILVVQAAEPVPWTKPVDLAYDPEKPLPPLGGVFTKPVHFLCYEINRRPGFTACFADGSARFIPSSTDERTVRALVTRNGGEGVDMAKLH
jgi:hypothetical protein